MCILASRFYLYRYMSKWTTGDAPTSTVLERYDTIRNHMTSNQTEFLLGMNECAILVQRLITQTILNTTTNPTANEIVTIAECKEILSKLCCNLFTITDDFQNEAGIGCYPRAALINHSCEPNCIQRFDHHANIVIRAVTDIPRGAELTISYTDTGNPTWYRQQELLRSYHFHCTCSRCTRADWNDAHLSSAALSDAHALPAAIESHVDFTYNSWLKGSVIPNIPSVTAASSSRAHPKLPLPRCPTSFCGARDSVDLLTCHACGAINNTNAVFEATELYGVYKSFIGSSQCQQYTPAEKLYTHVSLLLRILQLLQDIVADHSYSVYHVRKELKVACEELLPVTGGVLLFPPLAVRVAVKNAVAQIREMTSGTSITNANSAARDQSSEVVYTAFEVQRMYEENLRAIVRIMPHCYAADAPNLCHTFYRIQYVWYMLSKPDSVVHGWRGGEVHRSNSREYDRSVDAPELRRLAAESSELLHTVKVVYGHEHAFFADMQHCSLQLQRI